MSGAVAVVGLAGCAEDDDTEFEEGDSNGGDGDDEPDEADVEILEHEMVIDEGEFHDDIHVEGTVENNSGERLNYAEVTVRVFDEDGNQLESYIDNTTDLDDGGTWAFEVMILEDAEDIDSYDIAVEDITW